LPGSDDDRFLSFFSLLSGVSKSFCFYQQQDKHLQ